MKPDSEADVLVGEQIQYQARQNIHDQNSQLTQILGQLYAAVQGRLQQQSKQLVKVTRPLQTRLARGLSTQQGLLQQVTQPIQLGIKNAIAEQNIQLGQVAALPLLPAVPPRSDAATIRPLSVPAVRGVSVAPQSVQRPIPRAPAEPGVTDARLMDTTGPDGSGDVGTVSAPVAPPSATGDDTTEAVTNVVKLASCDLNAIVAALSRPSYNPYIDAARGLLTGEESKIVGFFGDAISEEFDADPSSAVSSLLMQTIIANP